MTNNSRPWKKAFELLAKPEIGDRSLSLKPFLSEKQSFDTLSRSLDTPTSSTPQTKSDFETRTAAINVTPGDTGHFDINQIKDDAVWLSQKAKIDEIAALRTVVIEWQGRPAEFINAGFPEEEIISLQHASGSRTGNFGSSLPTTKSQRSYAPESFRARLDAFNSTNVRRARLMRLLQTEQESVLAVSVLLEASHSLGQPSVPGTNQEDNPRLPWLGDLGGKVSHARLQQKNPNPLGSAKEPVLKAVEAIRRFLHDLEDGDNVFGFADSLLGGAAEYVRSQMCKIVRAMQLALVFVWTSPQNCSAAATGAWFKLMDEQGFFQSFLSVINSDTLSLVCLLIYSFSRILVEMPLSSLCR